MQEVTVFDLVPGQIPFSVCGFAHDNGFDLMYVLRDGRHGILKHRTDIPKDDRTDWIALGVLAALWTAGTFTTQLWLMGLAAMLYWRGWTTLFRRGHKGWHHVEHQVAMCLERDSSVLGLHRIRPYSARCGSTILIIHSMAVAVGFLTWQHGSRMALTYLPVAALWFLFNRNWREKMTPIRIAQVLSVIALPAWCVTMALQWLLFMRRPSEHERKCAALWTVLSATRIAQALLIPPHSPVIVYRPASTGIA